MTSDQTSEQSVVHENCRKCVPITLGFWFNKQGRSLSAPRGEAAQEESLACLIHLRVPKARATPNWWMDDSRDRDVNCKRVANLNQEQAQGARLASSTFGLRSLRKSIQGIVPKPLGSFQMRSPTVEGREHRTRHSDKPNSALGLQLTNWWLLPTVWLQNLTLGLMQRWKRILHVHKHRAGQSRH